ncbi:MAG: SAM-dependent methyltransferase [Herpetosiphonaceae bacterium]|nr:MAG: SAM-dependent methyltransferase [Herpetosiphonaceae bacterium]
MTRLLPIDWAELWRAQVTAEHAQYDSLCPPETRPDSDWWARLAARFYERTHRTPQPDAFLSLVLPHIRPGIRVLDVGAGTGRYALPLARAGAHVIAVEPSAGMRAYIERDAATEGLPIDIFPERWEDARVSPAEIVICSHVLYPVADAERFLRKLDDHTLERCFVFLGYRPPSAWLDPFWRAVYGVERLPLPGAIEALALLHQMGIDASLTPIITGSAIQFDTIEEALQELHWRLCLRPDEERDQHLREMLQSSLHPHPEGGLQVPQPRHMAVLAWDRQS